DLPHGDSDNLAPIEFYAEKSMHPAGAPKNVEELWQRLWPRSRFLAPLCFRRAPLLAAGCWFAAGVVAARCWRPAGWLLVELALLFMLALWALRASLRTAMLAVAATWFVLGWWCAEVQ